MMLSLLGRSVEVGLRIGVVACLPLGAVLVSPLHAMTLVSSTDPPISVTASDLRAELEANKGGKGPIATDPGQVALAVNELFRRKALAAMALAQGLDDTEAVQGRLQRARDETLALAAVEHKRQELLARIPDMTERAREVYRADPERFRAPERVRASHILLAATPEARKGRMGEMQAILKRLEEGEEFRVLAKDLSEDERTASSGGELPAFRRGEMVPAFEAAAFALETPGQLSEPISTPFGLHLIQLQERTPGRLRSFEEMRPSLTSKLRLQWLQEALEVWRKSVVDPSKATVDQAAIDALIEEFSVEAAATPSEGASTIP